jgi:ubiquinone biosynthesis protein UbiJ
MEDDAATTAADPVGSFLASLEGRPEVRLLRHAAGTLRIEVVADPQVEPWLVTVGDGRVAVSRSHGEADAVLRGEQATLERLVTGEANAMAAVLRGAVEVEGDLGLVILFQRLFPGPEREDPSPRPASRGPA